MWLLIRINIGSADEPDVEQDFRIAQPNVFPRIEDALQISGELTWVDHTKRIGSIRPDRTDDQPKYYWELPHHFELLPYGGVMMCGSPTTLADVPIGTHLHGSYFLGPDGEFDLPKRSLPSKPRISYDAPYSSALWLEDNFTFYARQGKGWRIEAVDLTNNELVVRLDDLPESPQLVSAAHGFSKFDKRGQESVTYRIDHSTRVWIGDRLATIDEVSPGQITAINITWATIRGAGQCTDIWLDTEARIRAMNRTLAKYRWRAEHLGFPARVEKVVHDEQGAKGIVTLRFMGFSPETLQPISEGDSITSCPTWPDLRTVRQHLTGRSGRILDVQRTEPSGPGDTGLTVTYRPADLFDGFRKGRLVKVFPGQTRATELPKEMSLIDGSGIGFPHLRVYERYQP